MSKTVLIVDASRPARVIAQAVLSSAGYDIRHASHSEEALEQMSSARIDVVITEIDIPLTGGIALLQQMKSSADLRDIPVLMLTKTAAARDLEQARDAGADAWVMKPYRPDTLIDAVARLIGRD